MAESSLREAIERADRGLIDADLGGGLIKQRVGRSGQGRSGGYRMVIAYRTEVRAVLLYAFAKNERDNIDDRELQVFRAIGDAWLRASAQEISQAIEDGRLHEVTDE